MFDEDISQDFFDDLLKTSFTYTAHNVEQTDKLHQKENGKRKTSELNRDEEELKKSKFDVHYETLVSENFRFPRTVQRKFPGPAGLLPDHCEDKNKSISEILQSDNIQKSNDQEIYLCSQQNSSVFEKSTWQNMVTDFQDTQRELLFEKFNINWIKTHFSNKKHLKNCKAPFLACTIDNLELIDGKIPTVKVVLKDNTGTIQGTILHSLYEEYSNYFKVETVLILKQFGVLSAYNSYCLTITRNNLLSIYYANTELPSDEKRQLESGKVEKILLQKYSIESIWTAYHESQINEDKSSLKINLDLTNKNSNILCSKNVFNKNPSKNDQIINVLKKPISEKLKDIPKSVKPNSSVTCQSQISITSDKAHMNVWKDLFQEVDTDAFFDDF